MTNQKAHTWTYAGQVKIGRSFMGTFFVTDSPAGINTLKARMAHLQNAYGFNTTRLLLCRQSKLEAIKTPLGWLIDPDDVARLAEERRRATSLRMPLNEGGRP